MLGDQRVRGRLNTPTGLHDLQPAVNDERSECTRSVPSVASRRVAAPYGVDVLAMGTSISSEKRSNFQRATRAKLISAYVELATLAEPVNDGHLQACNFCHPEVNTHTNEHQRTPFANC